MKNRSFYNALIHGKNEMPGTPAELESSLSDFIRTQNGEISASLWVRRDDVSFTSAANPDHLWKPSSSLMDFIENPSVDSDFRIIRHWELSSMDPAAPFSETADVLPLYRLGRNTGFLGLTGMPDTENDPSWIRDCAVLTGVLLHEMGLYRHLEELLQSRNTDLDNQGAALDYTLTVNERNMRLFKSNNAIAKMLLNMQVYSVSELLTLLSQIMPGFLDTQGITVYSVDKEKSLFRLVSSGSVSGDKPGVPAMIPIEDEGPMGRAYRSGGMVFLGPEELAMDRGGMSGARDSMVCLPLRSQNGILGMLNFLDKAGEPFDREDASHIGSLSTLLDMAIEKTSLFEAKMNSERFSLLGEMSAMIVHDIKNPITGIQGLAECLESPEFGEEERRVFIDTILQESGRLYDMTNEILDFARGQWVLELEETELGLYAQELDSYFRRLFHVKHIAINVACGSPGALVLIDRDRLRRALYNLTYNSYQALSDGDAITVELVMEGRVLYISVTDNGPGIPHERRDTLFQVFAPTVKKGGSGLGMSIVKRTMEAHGGTVRLDKDYTKGARFLMRLPAGI